MRPPALGVVRGVARDLAVDSFPMVPAGRMQLRDALDARAASALWPGLLAITALAFAIRFALVLWRGIDAPLFSDETLYGRAAASIAAGHGFRVDGITTAKCMPGWSMLMAVPFALFGPHAAVARVFTCLLGASTSLLLGLAANRLAGRRAALLAAAGAALYPPMVAYATTALTETPAIFWLSLAIWLLVEGRARGGAGWFVATGLALGMGLLTRGALAAFAAAACLAVFATPRREWRTAATRAALITAGAALVVAPWIARNAAVIGRATVSTQSQVQLWQGAHHGATGLNHIDWPRTKEKLASLARSGEVAMSDAMGREARQFIRDHPLEHARIGFVKAWELWKPWSMNVGLMRNLGYALSATLLLILGLGGTFSRERTGFDRMFLLGGIALFTLLHMLYTAIVRYRVPADVVLLLYAAAWVSHWGVGRERGAGRRAPLRPAGVG